VEPELRGAFSVALANGQIVACRPAFALLQELAAQYAPERSEALTGVSTADVRRAVRMFAAEQPSCFFGWTGLEQHGDAVQANRAVDLFYTLTGQFDQRGSNVLFANAAINRVMGFDLLPQKQAARRLGLSEHPLGPSRLPGNVPAYHIYRAILSGDPYPVKALVTFGSDLLLGRGDPMQGKAALETLDFSMHVDMFCNPSATFADLLLPACTCWEREALLPSFIEASKDTMTWIQFRQPVVPPLHESRSDMAIIFDLAKRLGVGEHFFDGDIEAAFDYQLAPSGLTVQQLRARPMGVRDEVQTHYQKYSGHVPQTGQPQGFYTPTGKVEIYSTTFSKAGYDPLPTPKEPIGSLTAAQEYPLVLTFFRIIQFCDEQHRNIPRLRRSAPEPFLEIHPHTATAAGIADGEWVVVETVTGRVRLKAKCKETLHPQVVATQYGWWQGCKELGLPDYDPFGPNGANANLLVPNEAIDPIGGSVPHRSQKCRIRKEGGSAETST
jgi:anaerobic selenocysteine-containing dehydrogenase